MSILSVANVHFETTGANRIEYREANGQLNIITSGNVAISSRNFSIGNNAGLAGNVFTSNGTTWISSPPGISVVDELSSASTYYPTLSIATSGTSSTANVSSTKLYYTPSTGTLAATNFNTLSDATYKKDIEPIKDALDKLDELTGVAFTWIDNNRKSMGVLAQDVELVAPELVSDINSKKSVNYDGLIGLIIQSIKELKVRIEKFESK